MRVEAETAILRHQWIVSERTIRGRVRFTNSDRLFFTWLYRWFSSVLDASQPPRDSGAVAQCRFSSLLALEVLIRRWSAANRCGTARVDPTDERRQSAPREIADARFDFRQAQAQLRRTIAAQADESPRLTGARP